MACGVNRAPILLVDASPLCKRGPTPRSGGGGGALCPDRAGASRSGTPVDRSKAYVRKWVSLFVRYSETVQGSDPKFACGIFLPRLHHFRIAAKASSDTGSDMLGTKEHLQ